MSEETLATLEAVEVGRNVRTAREEQEMSRYALAVASGMRENTIYRIENGVNLPTLDAIARLAVALSKSIDELCGLTSGPTA